MPNIEFRQNVYVEDAWEGDFKLVESYNLDSLSRKMKNLEVWIDSEDSYSLSINWLFSYDRASKKWKVSPHDVEVYNSMYDAVDIHSDEVQMIILMLKQFYRPEYDEEALKKRLNDAIKVRMVAKEQELARLKSLVVA